MKPICQRHTKGDSTSGGDRRELGTYYAVVKVDNLPSGSDLDDRYVRRGFAVNIQTGAPWLFFTALPPAMAFGRAARMSADCGGYSVVEAAFERQFCDEHGDDEIALLVGRGGLDRREDEVHQLKLFVQAVKENDWSSHWHEPTGYITDYNDGQPMRSRRRSLPL
ncbi:hypothetical protein ACFVBP_21685 [Nocardioides sp. NPDC057764]|uniref:hypothetical protein n=1 Tax=Nocardioides sp. NPDC057764 TaxID=3346243 RepID=UPI00366D60A0